MENILRLAVIMLVLTGSFSSCSERKEGHVDEDCLFMFNIVHDESASIIGKWKLVKERYAFRAHGISCIDYSTYDIVCEFKENNVLTVSAKPGTPEIWPKTGEHVYSIIEDEDRKHRLMIDNSHFLHSISSGSKELIIDQSPVDGAIRYLIKIQ